MNNSIPANTNIVKKSHATYLRYSIVQMVLVSSYGTLGKKRRTVAQSFRVSERYSYIVLQDNSCLPFRII